ncbi:MAG: hypothetical protein S4CHLAM6_04990 [Chlamydiae bacterium]|nr:hypothetical protein [Chlamydiota bacterium]
MTEYREQKKQFTVILIVVFLGFLGISMPYLIFPSLFLNPEYSFLPIGWDKSSQVIFLGMTLAAYPFGQFIGSPILGALSDEYGRKTLITWTLIFSAIASVLSGVAITMHQLWLLILSRFIAGLMEGNVAIARAMCADLKKISKHKTFGRINAASSIAYLVGPLLGALITNKNIFSKLTTSTPFYFISILFVFLSALAFFILKKSPTSMLAQRRTLWQHLNLVKRLQNLFSNKYLKTLLITSTCFTLAVDIFYQFSPIYLTEKWMTSPSQLILYNGSACIGLVIGNGWFPVFISTRFSTWRGIWYSMGSYSIVLLLIISFNSSSLMVLLFALAGITIGVVVTLITVKISDSTTNDIQGEVMGTQLSLRVLGDGIICLIGAALMIISSKIILITASMLVIATLTYSLKRRVLKTN